MRFMMLMIPKGYETAAPGTMPACAIGLIQRQMQALCGRCQVAQVGRLALDARVIGEFYRDAGMHFPGERR